MNADSSRAVKSDSGRPFNPYHKWLGIRDAQTPPNHYRLLGLELWETDEDVIREAYSRQMNHVRHFWIGPHRDLCQQILDELLAARETLVDAQLRRPLRPLVEAGIKRGGSTDLVGEPIASATFCGSFGAGNHGCRRARRHQLPTVWLRKRQLSKVLFQLR